MANLTFKDFITEELSTWDKVKKRYRQGSVKSRIGKIYDKAVDKHSKAMAISKWVSKNAGDRDKWGTSKTTEKADNLRYKAGNFRFDAADAKFGFRSKDNGEKMTPKSFAQKYSKGKLGMPK